MLLDHIQSGQCWWPQLEKLMICVWFWHSPFQCCITFINWFNCRMLNKPKLSSSSSSSSTLFSNYFHKCSSMFLLKTLIGNRGGEEHTTKKVYFDRSLPYCCGATPWRNILQKQIRARFEPLIWQFAMQCSNHCISEAPKNEFTNAKLKLSQPGDWSTSPPNCLANISINWERYLIITASVFPPSRN